jgi:hypothetical protein
MTAGLTAIVPAKSCKDDDAQKHSVQDAIQMVAPVIANPQGEAIHARTLDCFTAFAMTAGLTAIVIITDA